MLPKPLSSDLRQRVIDNIIAGYSARASACWFGVSESFAIKPGSPPADNDGRPVHRTV